jgi:succinate dehydrogenase/fumarate reductase flavoprotein subunit
MPWLNQKSWDGLWQHARQRHVIARESRLTRHTGFFGGNSTKATSGINGALTRTQVDHQIGDSVKQFYDDTMKSARDKARPDLIKVLTYKSAAAVEWLQDVFNLDLTLVSRLG